MSAATPKNTPVVLIIRDGWGENPHPEHDSFNAVLQANTPVADRLMQEWPHTLIHTSGQDVGLLPGQTGNSEVGHQNIGAGRIVYQDAMRITNAIRTGDFQRNAALCEGIERAKAMGKAVHLMGIASEAGVHGLLSHLYACLELCRRLEQERVFVHLFTDGRDTGPFTGKGFVGEVIEAMNKALPTGRVASVIGRYWAMDRDNRWERVEKAYNCLTGRHAEASGGGGEVAFATDALEAIQHFYDHPLSDRMKGDEFVTPTMIGSTREEALASRIQPDDTVIFYNYRGDRPREIIRAFVLDEFEGEVKPSPDTSRRGFARGPKIGVHMVTMAEYERDLSPYVNVAFPKAPPLDDILGMYLARLGLAQFRSAETEKYPHVTFFFNDYRDEPFPNEQREMAQSPKVSTYDQQPEMSAHQVRDLILARLNAGDDCEDFILVNFANPDMVGHTGNHEAVVRAVEVTDACVGAIVEATLARHGCVIVTADHGNAEQTFDPTTNAPHTAHTTYDVPLIVVGEAVRGRALREDGRLADIAPTVLGLMGLEQPAAMDGRSLLADT